VFFFFFFAWLELADELFESFWGSLTHSYSETLKVGPLLLSTSERLTRADFFFSLFSIST
jgi:hypothetical protein